MESERQAFLDALKRNPDDDTTRLVFADYLDEHDEPEEAERMRQWRGAKDRLTALTAGFGGTCVNYGESYDEGFAESWVPITFDDVIQAGHDTLRQGWAGLIQVGSETARDLMYAGDNLKKFWDDWQIVTGVRITEEQRAEVPFGCSC